MEYTNTLYGRVPYFQFIYNRHFQRDRKVNSITYYGYIPGSKRQHYYRKLVCENPFPRWIQNLLGLNQPVYVTQQISFDEHAFTCSSLFGFKSKYSSFNIEEQVECTPCPDGVKLDVSIIGHLTGNRLVDVMIKKFYTSYRLDVLRKDINGGGDGGNVTNYDATMALIDQSFINV